MLLDICREFIKSGIEKDKFLENCQLLSSLVLIKYMTMVDESNAQQSKYERKRMTGFTLPHTADFNYIMKYIDSNRLYEIIDDAFIKIEKRNLQYKNQIAFRKKTNNNDIKIDGMVEEKEKLIKIEELDLDSDIFIRLLNEINIMNNDEFGLVNDFLNNEAYTLFNENERIKRKEFEDKRMTIFKGDIPISIENSIIFDKIFIVEHWIRRIIMFVLMTEYGADWIKAFTDKDLKEYEKTRKKLSGRENQDFKDDNLLWYSTISYLDGFIKRQDIQEKIENVTDMKAQSISEAVLKIKDIRNEVAHNRTITKIMEEDYNENFNVLEEAIINFKRKTIYSKSEEIVGGFGIASKKSSGFITYFNKLEKEHFKAFGTQSFIQAEKDFYSIVLLPCESISGEFINIGIILEKFSIFKDYIVAFYVNKECGEYQIIVTKKVGAEKMIYESIINTFFDTVKSIGTDATYELQESKYTCNPKIWFYENSFEVGLSNGLW